MMNETRQMLAIIVDAGKILVSSVPPRTLAQGGFGCKGKARPQTCQFAMLVRRKFVLGRTVAP